MELRQRQDFNLMSRTIEGLNQSIIVWGKVPSPCALYLVRYQTEPNRGIYWLAGCQNKSITHPRGYCAFKAELNPNKFYIEGQVHVKSQRKKVNVKKQNLYT